MKTKYFFYCRPDNEEYDWLDIDTVTGALTVKNDSLVNADLPVWVWHFNYTCTAVDSMPDHISEPLNVRIILYFKTLEAFVHSELKQNEAIDKQIAVSDICWTQQKGK